MSDQRTRGRRNSGFTLIELLITLAILGILAAITIPVVTRVRARCRSVRCLNNQKEISTAICSFYLDHSQFPSDDPKTDLAIELDPYISWPEHLHKVALPGLYRCPNDPEDDLCNSYAPFYVRRRDTPGPDCFVLGCPRHKEVEGSYINTMGLSPVRSVRSGQIKINGAQVSSEGTVGPRSMTSGTMTFEDGTEVNGSASSGDYRVTAIASFRQEAGNLYTIVRVMGKGDTQFSVHPGSRFEVVTPVALIGVQGTEFSVKTDDGYAKIELTSGTIQVWDRLTQAGHLLDAPATLEIGPAPPISLDELCIHCRKHCKNGSHCKRCPLHVGKPENIGTDECVECPWSCRWGKHCKRFCPLHPRNRPVIGGYHGHSTY